LLMRLLPSGPLLQLTSATVKSEASLVEAAVPKTPQPRGGTRCCSTCKQQRAREVRARSRVVRCESRPGAVGDARIRRYGGEAPAVSLTALSSGVVRDTRRWRRLEGVGLVFDGVAVCLAVLTLGLMGGRRGAGVPAGGGVVRLSGSAGARCPSERAGSPPDAGAGPRSRPRTTVGRARARRDR
jgi:hypothetical protein